MKLKIHIKLQSGEALESIASAGAVNLTSAAFFIETAWHSYSELPWDSIKEITIKPMPCEGFVETLNKTWKGLKSL